MAIFDMLVVLPPIMAVLLALVGGLGLMGTLVALPMSKLLSAGVRLSLLQMPLACTYALYGVATWLVAVVALAAVARLAPARSATRLTVRELLAYE